MPPGQGNERWISGLRGLLGDDSVLSNDGATITVFPKDTSQVAAVMQFASNAKLMVDPIGGATKQQWGGGSTPQLLLSLVRLNRLIDHSWQDLTCTAQAGCTWTEMQRQLAMHGQFVALDPLFADRATVGGVLAVNDSGFLRQRYGSLRDLVIGMTLVLSDGTIARTGGKVVKNVAGYDLSKLMIGSLGTLAVITEVNFRLHSLPQYAHTFTVVSDNSNQVSRLLATIRGSQLLLQGLQLRRSKADARMDITLTSDPAAKQDQSLSEMVQTEGLTLQKTVDGGCFARDWMFVEGATFIRVSTLPADVCDFSDALQAMTAGIDAVSTSQALGLHDVVLRGGVEEVEEVIKRMRMRSLTKVAVLYPGSAKIPAFAIPTSVMAVMQAVKQNFDPNGILGAGKFFTMR